MFMVSPRRSQAAVCDGCSVAPIIISHCVLNQFSLKYLLTITAIILLGLNYMVSWAALNMALYGFLSYLKAS
jgi:hypothetical protein